MQAFHSSNYSYKVKPKFWYFRCLFVDSVFLDIFNTVVSYSVSVLVLVSVYRLSTTRNILLYLLMTSFQVADIFVFQHTHRGHLPNEVPLLASCLFEHVNLSIEQVYDQRAIKMQRLVCIVLLNGIQFIVQYIVILYIEMLEVMHIKGLRNVASL